MKSKAKNKKRDLGHSGELGACFHTNLNFALLLLNTIIIIVSLLSSGN